MQHSKAYENMRKLEELLRSPGEHFDSKAHMLFTELLISLPDQKDNILLDNGEPERETEKEPQPVRKRTCDVLER